MAVGAEQRLVARRAGMGPANRRMRRRSTSPGSCCPIATAAACCCRCWASPYGEALTARRDRAEISIRRPAASRRGISTTAFRSIRSATATSSRPSWRRRKRQTSPRAARCSRSPTEYGTPGAPSYAQAPELKQRLAADPGAADVIERGLVAYRADHENGVTSAAPAAGTAALSPRRLAARRRPASTIGASSTSTSWPVFASRTCGTFRDDPRLVGKLIATGQLHGLRLDHIDGLLRPAAIHRAPAAVHPQRAKSQRAGPHPPRPAVLRHGREDPGGRRAAAAVLRRRRHHRLRMAQPASRACW